MPTAAFAPDIMFRGLRAVAVPNLVVEAVSLVVAGRRYDEVIPVGYHK